MAYALANPVKKITQAGDSNSIFFYTDGDATSTVVGSGYFNLSATEFKQGDMILCANGIGGTIESDLLVVTSASGATTETTAKLA